MLSALQMFVPVHSVSSFITHRFTFLFTSYNKSLLISYITLYIYKLNNGQSLIPLHAEESGTGTACHHNYVNNGWYCYSKSSSQHCHVPGQSFVSFKNMQPDGSRCKYYRWLTPKSTLTSTPASSPVVPSPSPTLTVLCKTKLYFKPNQHTLCQ